MCMVMQFVYAPNSAVCLAAWKTVLLVGGVGVAVAVAVTVMVTVAWVPSSMYCVNPGVAGSVSLGWS